MGAVPAAIAPMIRWMMAAATAQLRLSRKVPEHEQALARIREWTRERFGLEADNVVLAAEVTCRVPGCPPVETVVAFWIGDTRHRFKFFKPARAIIFADFPPAWLRNALAAPDGFECDCC